MKTLILIIVILGFTVASCDNEDHQIGLKPTMVDVGGYKLYTLSSGTGPYTIVFEAGLGDGANSFKVNNIFNAIAQNNQVISYNRAGYAPSDNGEEPRDLAQLSAELHKVITAISLNEKVILVGHSLGGAIIRHYAINHPEKVKALLFIDPSHEDYKVITQVEEDEIVQLYLNTGRTEVASEAEQLIEDLDILHRLPNLPNIPVRVLTSIKLENNLTPEDRQNWSNAHSNLGVGIDNFVQIKTENSGHYIQKDQPELVLSSIEVLKN